jgi:hypothetical protein
VKKSRYDLEKHTVPLLAKANESNEKSAILFITIRSILLSWSTRGTLGLCSVETESSNSPLVMSYD